jgi:hypothetical protein
MAACDEMAWLAAWVNGIEHSGRVGGQTEMPGFVTHYYLAGRRPFLSLSELGDADLAAALAGLCELNRAGSLRRTTSCLGESPWYADLAENMRVQLQLHRQ